ncbi:unnamed protein product [Oikopleura dioica]|uniref:Uncharacterized protein n=1 Tax=Oikopleura dioica TaxID=34765 RepID=E4X331_OIKDI|nr:unnamed protein product [Oikopleura dioica]
MKSSILINNSKQNEPSPPEQVRQLFEKGRPRRRRYCTERACYLFFFKLGHKNTLQGTISCLKICYRTFYL